MNKENIKAKFLELAGNTATSPDTLIELAMFSTQASLSSDPATEEAIAIIETLCAAEAYYQYMLLQLCQSARQVKAGDIVVTKEHKDSRDAALSLLLHSRLAAREYIEDTSFFVGGVY